MDDGRWAITPGTYWVAFEAAPGATFGANARPGAPNPLGNEAFENASSAGWVPSDALELRRQGCCQ